ncbi:MAG: spermidine/putrescine ABC transporter substrate-binding protein [Caldilineae bacterium]|nr:MAG: spermidine/putrescine ABC transporter substrate-binding protein [Caldilineae bacterium]
MRKAIGALTLLLLTALLLTACQGQGKNQLAKELHVYNWSEYIDPEVYTAFEEKYGVKVIEDTFSSNEELLAKLQAGAAGYDVIVPSDYMVEIMIDQGLLAELNHDNIPNLSNLSPLFNNPPYDPGLKHCVPYQWGTTGIGYNTEEFDEPPDSWAYLFDPDMASQYAGKITMLNDSREAIGAALKYLGYSLNTTNEAELEEAKQVLLAQKPFLYSYDSDQFEDLIAADEVIIGHGWSGDYFAAAVEDERIWYVIPKEGAVVWADNLCIPASSKNQYTAELFLDFILQPEIAAQITNFTWYASPVEAANEFIDPEILNEPAIYPSAETMQRLEWIQDVGEATPLYERIWTEVKAAGQ